MSDKTEKPPETLEEVVARAYRMGFNAAIDAALKAEPSLCLGHEVEFRDLWRERIAALRRPQPGARGKEEA